MATVCPTITAFDMQTFNEQIEVVRPFAERIHIDLMDGEFAPTVSPGLDKIWWPHELQADVHLMYQRPMEALDALIQMKPHMVIIHNEVDVHHMHFSAELHKEGIKVGLALLQDTPIEWAEQIMHSFDQVLIFSGDLGHHGGEADMTLLNKVAFAHKQHPEVELAWDGGISADNATELVKAGISVLNVGGYIHDSENPEKAYDTLLEKTRS